MKILIVIDYFQPKIGYSEYYLAKEFLRLGHSVKVLTSNLFFPFPEYQDTVAQILGERRQGVGVFIEEGIQVIRRAVFFEIFCRTIFNGHEDCIKEFAPDLVIVNGSVTYHALIISRLKKQYGFDLVLMDSHLPSEYFRDMSVAKKFFYFCYRFFFVEIISNEVDRFVAVQEDTKYIMKKIYGIRNKINIIDLGVDSEVFKFEKKSRKLCRESLDITDKDVLALYAGKLISTKGLEILFDAFALLEAKAIRLHLALVGEGEPGFIAKLKSKIINKANIHFIPMQPQNKLAFWYSGADFAVWPLQETTAMNEAASCGLPFIANDQLGAKTRIENDNALLYKRGDARDLADKMFYLYAHPKQRADMGVRGRALVEKKLDWKIVAQKYLQSTSI